MPHCALAFMVPVPCAPVPVCFIFKTFRFRVDLGFEGLPLASGGNFVAADGRSSTAGFASPARQPISSHRLARLPAIHWCIAIVTSPGHGRHAQRVSQWETMAQSGGTFHEQPQKWQGTRSVQRIQAGGDGIRAARWAGVSEPNVIRHLLLRVTLRAIPHCPAHRQAH